MVEVLLIEDDIIVQHVHKLMFAKLGVPIDMIDSGLDALEKIKNSHYKIIFIDIGLPDINGIEIIKIIHNNPTIYQTPVLIALTGYIGNQEKEASLAAGAHKIMHKPILIEDLSETLNIYLNQEKIELVKF